MYVFFYIGLGLSTADGQGLYLIPPRAAEDLIDDTAIPFSKINAAIQSAEPKSVTMILDACYSGQARSGETLIAGARPITLKTKKDYSPITLPSSLLARTIRFPAPILILSTVFSATT